MFFIIRYLYNMTFTQQCIYQTVNYNIVQTNHQPAHYIQRGIDIKVEQMNR